MLFNKIIINDKVHIVQILQQNNKNQITPKDNVDGNKKEKSTRFYSKEPPEEQQFDNHRKLRTDGSSANVLQSVYTRIYQNQLKKIGIETELDLVNKTIIAQHKKRKESMEI